MDNKGRGITYKDNKIVFVNNALTNEDVDIKVILDKKNYMVADVLKYNIKSDDRIKPKCKYFGFCGGCNMQHLKYDKQLEYKLEYLNDMFKKLNIKVSNIISCNPFLYRNKITLKVKDKIGFYKLNTNEIVEIKKCMIAEDNINEKLKYLEKLDITNIDEIIIKTFNDKTMLVINSSDNVNINEIKNYFDAIYINNKLVSGNRIIADINGIKYLIAPNGFFQVNLKVASKMFEHIKNICIKENSKNVLDMYCGCGSISLYIATIVDKVLGVELNQASIKDANENKLLNNIYNVDFICDTTDNIKNLTNFDTIIVDPPRSGLSKKLINKVLDSKIDNIIYVSCDPATLKRDLEILSKNYKVENITSFDMFANTYHVECVCLLKLER